MNKEPREDKERKFCETCHLLVSTVQVHSGSKTESRLRKNGLRAVQ